MQNVSHIAFIMDGNGRWAKKRALPRQAGHNEGVRVLEKVVDYCDELKIKHLTFFAFSTENWARPQKEIDNLFAMVKRFAEKNMIDYARRNFQLKIIGDRTKIPADVNSALDDSLDMAKNNTGTTVSIALNYGGQDDIIRAVNTAISAGERNMTNESFEKYLDTYPLPNPDIVVRTAGEQRLSNFLLWQSAYSEFIFVDTLWPDVNKKTIDSILEEYNKRDRKFGKIK